MVVNIAIGAVGGVVAGLILTVAVRFWDRFRERREREAEIERLADTLTEYRARVYEISDDEVVVNGVIWSKRLYRLNLCRELFEKLDRSLERSSRLAFDETEDLVAIKREFETDRYGSPRSFVELFEAVESLSWLTLEPASSDYPIFSEAQDQA